MRTALALLLSLAGPLMAQSPPRVVIPLPDRDFDLTEVVVPWDALTRAGYQVVFATERGPAGPVPECDPRLIDEPLLRALRLTAREEYVGLYRRMRESPQLRAPIGWSEIDPAASAGLVLPGGHWKRGMRQYLEGEALRPKVLEFFRLGRPVAAICHGPIVLARTLDPATGKSVLHGRRVAALTKPMEKSAWILTRLKLGDYYRTYEQTVEDEVKAALGPEGRFERGPFATQFYAAFGPGHVTLDGNLVTARFPGDAHAWAQAYLRLLQASAPATPLPGPGLSGAVQGE